jgi:hypothetical protein
MALFFNLDTLEHYSGGNYVTLVEILENFFTGTIPKNKYVRLPKYNPQKLRGESFLLNPRDLFKDPTDTAYKAQYIRLAARRSYMLYRMYGFRDLDLSLYPDLAVDSIKHNPLLTINKSTIKFNLESK